MYLVVGFSLVLDYVLIGRLGFTYAQVFFVPFVYLGAFLLLERYGKVHRPEYRHGVQGTWVDTGFFLWTMTAVRPALRGILLSSIYPFVERLRGASAGMSPLPLIVQVVVGFLVLTFMHYWIHRIEHGPLWSVHKLHHMAQQLNTQKFWLSHPLEIAITTVSMLPVLALGMAPRALDMLLFLQGTLCLTAHANVALRPLPGGLFTSIHEHEVHHASEPEDERSNFGTITLLWDHVFRTYRAPRAEYRRLGFETGGFATERDYLKAALRLVFTPWKSPSGQRQG